MSSPGSLPLWQIRLGWSAAAAFFLYAFVLRVSPSVMVDELMRDFAVGAAILGNLSAFYFYAYASLQMPVGLLLDRYGPRRLISAAAALAAIGSFLFALSDTVASAYVGRFLIGAGVAFSWVGALTVTALYFPPHRFAVLSGVAQAAGMVGGIFGQAPVGMAVAAWGWRWTMGGIAIAGAALAIVIWAAVRDRPHETARRTPLLSGLYSVMRRRETWLASAYGLAMTAPMLSFAGLWAVPYLTTIYGMSRPAAAGMSSLMFLGWAIGAPAIGWLSDHVQRRRLLMVGFGTLSAASLTALVLVPDHSLPALAGLFFVNGVGSCSMILAFAHAREHNTRETGGAALGFVNTAVVGSGALFQPLLGALLDLRWDGTMESGVRLYALDAYQLALAALPLTAAAGVAAAIAMRETYARPQA